MTRLQICVRHDAELDAHGYFEYIRERNPEAAFRFLDAIDETVEALASQPLVGRLRRFRGKDLKNIRSWRVNEFENYLIFYRVTVEEIEVLRIKHGSMNFPRALRTPLE